MHQNGQPQLMPSYQEQRDAETSTQEQKKRWVDEEEEEDEIQEVDSPRFFSMPPVVGSQFAMPFPLELTVSKKAGPAYNMGDFSIRDSHDKVIFMVSARNDNTRSNRVLLNSHGVPLLCAHRKALSLYNRWDVFRGEQPKPDELLFSVKRSAYFQLKTSLHVFLASPKKETKPQFKVKGNYLERSCTVFHDSQIIAEVKRKYTDTKLQMDKNTFTIVVHPGADYAFITTLIIVMDEIHIEQEYSSSMDSR